MDLRSTLSHGSRGPWLTFGEGRPPILLHLIFASTLLLYAGNVLGAHLADGGFGAPTTLLLLCSILGTAALWPLLPWTPAASPPHKAVTIAFLLCNLGLLSMSTGHVTPLIIFVATGNAVVVLGQVGAAAAGAVPVAMTMALHIVGGSGPVRALGEGAIILLFCAIAVLAFTALTASRNETRRTTGLLEELRTAHEELRRRAERGRELAVAEERARMAREMHDSVGHYLTVINMGLTNARRYRGARPEDAWREVEEAQQLTQEALADTRRWVRALRPLKLEGRAGVEAMRTLADAFSGSGIEVAFQATPDLPELDEGAELVLYRALQEGLTNTARHSGASTVGVELTGSDGGVELRIHDNGAGVAPDSASSGLGLNGLRERAEEIGGSLSAKGPPEGGFELRIRVPSCRHAPAEAPA